MREDRRMTSGVLRVFANTILELADILEPPRAFARKFVPVDEAAIDELKEALRNANMADDAGEFDVPEEECEEIAKAALDDFGSLVDHARKDPEFKIYRRPTADDLEDALLGIRRAQEALDHLKFGITKRRPDFAIDLDQDGAEAEKCRILNRLEDLANHPKLIDDIEKEDPDFPQELLDAARKLAGMKASFMEGKQERYTRRFELAPQVEALVESLYAAGVRAPYGLRSSLYGLYAKGRKFKTLSAKPLGIRTTDYDTTQRYALGDTVYLRMLDDKTQLTSEDTGFPLGKVTGVPTEQDPMLRVDVEGDIE